MKNRKNILIIGLLAIISAIGFGWYMYHKPVESLENKTPDIKIKASELVIAFETDEQSANQKYLDKILEISGVIDKVQNNNIYIKTENPLSSVICEMSGEHSLSEIKPEEKITIKGLCTGYLLDVVLVRCTIIK